MIDRLVDLATQQDAAVALDDILQAQALDRAQRLDQQIRLAADDRAKTASTTRPGTTCC